MIHLLTDILGPSEPVAQGELRFRTEGPGRDECCGTPYNFTEHQLELGELFAKVTKPVGWNVRGLFQDDHLAPYEVWRQLRFLEFKIRLRDLIITRLNATLAEVGSQLGFQAAIELSGLPTLQDVDAAKSCRGPPPQSLKPPTRPRHYLTSW
jgi:hypothetical protein